MKQLPETYIPGWADQIVQEEGKIKGFFAQYRFLSNFYPSEVYLETLRFKNVECAYQAAKVWPDDRHLFQSATPAESKLLWKTLPLLDETPDQWNNRRYEVMAGLVFQKYHINLNLRKRLLDTGENYLEETNAWGDVFFGTDIKKGGENKLGKLLMNVRDFWKKSENM